MSVRAPSGRTKSIKNYKDLIEKGGRPSLGGPSPPKIGHSKGGRKKALKAGYKPALSALAKGEKRAAGGKSGKKEGAGAGAGTSSSFLEALQTLQAAQAAAALGGAGAEEGGGGGEGGERPKSKKKRFTLEVLTSGAVDAESVVIGGAKPGSPRFVLPPNFNKYSKKQRRRLLVRQAEAAARAGADASEVAEAMLADPLLARVLAEQGTRDKPEGGGGGVGGGGGGGEEQGRWRGREQEEARADAHARAHPAVRAAAGQRGAGRDDAGRGRCGGSGGRGAAPPAEPGGAHAPAAVRGRGPPVCAAGSG